MVAFREELKSRADSGTETVRRVRFAECDYSNKAMSEFLLKPNEIDYPNVVMYMFGQIIPFNPFGH
jgi:hypothetical protein